ncbi:MAG: sugar phosphate isomerase/epimerase [candidate division KSB1 bacterium]|nr:sugar phosphate isomerase/epimerase [candidate division KSB1 bacterium]
MNSVPRVGVTIAAFKSLSAATLISRLRLMGVNFFELNISTLKDIKSIHLVIKRAHTAIHLPIMSENGWDFSCPAYEQDIREIIKTINAYRCKLHIQHCIAHPPEPHLLDRNLESSEDYLFCTLSQLNVPVYLENVPGIKQDEYDHIYNRAKDKLGDQLAGMCYDGPHFLISGQNPVEQFQQYQDKIGAIHISDCYPEEDVHLPFDRGGVMPYKELLKSIKSSGFKGYLTLEIQPVTLQDVPAFFKSYLTTLRSLHYQKYLCSTLRYQLMRPLWHYYQKHHMKK